ncbi:MAG: HPr family phosphocarrier protein [Clostridia bacterium]|nr:HPr family phosphocarrier protein [Clostridia bacterium]
MVTKNVTVVNDAGFHMRPATVFAGEMGKFKSNITLETRGMCLNGKSVMNIIAAGMKKGTVVTITCEGEDEELALAAAADMIESGLGE